MNKDVILICDECLSRNYHYRKSNSSSKRLNLNKFCPKCNKKSLHKESK